MSESSAGESTVTVLVAIATNLAIAVAKAVVAALTGSAAMTAEAIHSLVDTLNEAILYLGIRRSRKAPNERHPFGYGRELYFWTLVVAVVIFGVGGGVTIVEGVERLVAPHALEDAFWTYVVLGVSFVLESVSWTVSYRAVMQDSNGGSVLATIRESKDPTTFTVLIEDSAALVGLALAALGTFVGHATGNRSIDGITSIAIGLVLLSVSMFLVGESRALLVGESARRETIVSIRAIVVADRDVAALERAIAMQLAPQTILVFLNVCFDSHLSARDVVAAIERIEAAIRRRHTDVATIFIEPTDLESPSNRTAFPDAMARADIVDGGKDAR